jgi:N-acyl-D-amino-acid deacylase
MSALGKISTVSIIAKGPSLDIIIKNGSIIDGTGSPEKIADIGIKGERIEFIGNLKEAEAGRIIDARGLKVVPGFIDIHSHTDVDLFINPKGESKIRQGVTTEVCGNDGSSWAPIGGRRELDLERLKQRYGLSRIWSDFAGFFSALERRRISQNLLSLVGLGSVRAFVIGMEDRRPRGDEMDRMKREVIKGIEQGCWGASTGLEYTPGSFATTDEIIELLRTIPEKYRLYATHIRNEDMKLLEAIDEAIDIARRSGARLQISHLKASGKRNWWKLDRALEKIEKAVSEGVEIHCDRYPYTAYNTRLASLFPIWSREGGNLKFIKRLKDKKLLGKIRDEVEKKINMLGSWDAVMISFTSSEKNKKYQGMTIKQIAEELNMEPFDVCRKLIIEENNDVNMVGFGMSDENTDKVISYPRTIISSDGGSFAPYGILSRSNPHPRTYGTFPRAIARYVRERKLVPLPEMIKKMTLMPAEKLGLKDRGKIAKGMFADIVIFDFDKIEDRATYTEPHRYPVGINYVIVNGVIVIENGRHTGAFPGMILRSE